MTAAEWAMLGAALLGAAGVAYAAWRAGRATEHTPYSALADRVLALEKSDREARKRIGRLETREAQLVRYLRSLLEWADGGAAPPPPDPPSDLADFLARWPHQ